MSQFEHLESQSLSPYDMEYFDNLSDQVKQMYEFLMTKQLLSQAHQPFPYKKYLQKQRKALERNQEHCKQRNQWYKQEIKKSWQISISNRQLVLRSLARTNILKRQADEWLSGIDDKVLGGYVNDSYGGSSGLEHEGVMSESLRGENDLKGSKLIDKYNDILAEYYHKI